LWKIYHKGHDLDEITEETVKDIEEELKEWE